MILQVNYCRKEKEEREGGEDILVLPRLYFVCWRYTKSARTEKVKEYGDLRWLSRQGETEELGSGERDRKKEGKTQDVDQS